MSEMPPTFPPIQMLMKLPVRVGVCVRPLSKFDRVHRAVAAGLALECPLPYAGLVRLDAREPHRCAAFGAGRMDDVL
jgi:hypothetical protein